MKYEITMVFRSGERWSCETEQVADHFEAMKHATKVAPDDAPVLIVIKAVQPERKPNAS
jgi:hypothetical protein